VPREAIRRVEVLMEGVVLAIAECGWSGLDALLG